MMMMAVGRCGGGFGRCVWADAEEGVVAVAVGAGRRACARCKASKASKPVQPASQPARQPSNSQAKRLSGRLLAPAAGRWLMIHDGGLLPAFAWLVDWLTLGSVTANNGLCCAVACVLC